MGSDAPKPPKLPKCPACYAQPLRYGANILPASGGLLVSFVWCSDCGHVFSAEVLGQQPPSPIVRA